MAPLYSCLRPRLASAFRGQPFPLCTRNRGMVLIFLHTDEPDVCGTLLSRRHERKTFVYSELDYSCHYADAGVNEKRCGHFKPLKRFLLRWENLKHITTNKRYWTNAKCMETVYSTRYLLLVIKFINSEQTYIKHTKTQR